MENKRKFIYLEIMRIVAVFLVLFNHVRGYSLYKDTDGYIRWLYMFFTMLTRIHVPLFFMVSGALLLGKTEDFMTVLNKRIRRFSLVILLFTFAFVVLKFIMDTDYQITAFEFFVGGVLNEKITGLESYWYLYAYVGFLFMLTFMQRIAKDFSKQEFYMLLVVHLVMSTFLPIANIICEGDFRITGVFQVPLATEKAFFYPLMGYYLEKKVDIQKLNKKTCLSLVGIALAAIFIASGFTYYEGITTGTFTENFVQLFDYIIAIVAFLLIKYVVVVMKPQFLEGKLASIICLVGSLTFGIYLIGPFLKTTIYSPYVTIAKRIPIFIVGVVWCFLAMIIGGAITYLLKKVPVFRKIL